MQLWVTHLCRCHLAQPPSKHTQCLVFFFPNSSSPGHPLLPAGLGMPRGVGDAMPRRGHALWHGQEPQEQRAVCPGSRGWWPARGDALCCLRRVTPRALPLLRWLLPALLCFSPAVIQLGVFRRLSWRRSRGLWLAGLSVTHKTQMQMWRGQSAAHKQHPRCSHSSVQSQGPSQPSQAPSLNYLLCLSSPLLSSPLTCHTISLC